MDITFSNTAYLWFLLVIPLIIFSHFFSLKVSKGKAIKFANFDALKRIDDSKKISRNWALLFLRVFVLSLMILAIASPVLWYSGLSSDIDYVIAVDTSGSMLAEDFTPNRLEAAKYSAILFVEGVAVDTNIGIVSFSGNAFVEQSLTSDLGKVKETTKSIGARFSSGTSIGDAVIASSNLFSPETKRSKVIIILTDGQNTVGTPTDKAIDYAKEKGVIIYTLGVGTKEGALFGAIDATSRLDEEGLVEIAESTDGEYFYTGDQDQLINAFKIITSKNKKRVPLELSTWMLLFILVLLALEWGLINTIYKVSP